MESAGWNATLAIAVSAHRALCRTCGCMSRDPRLLARPKGGAPSSNARGDAAVAPSPLTGSRRGDVCVDSPIVTTCRWLLCSSGGEVVAVGGELERLTFASAPH